MLPACKVLACYWPRRSSNSSFYSLCFRIHNVHKQASWGWRGGRNRFKLQNIVLFPETSRRGFDPGNILVSLKMNKLPKEEWQKQPKMCAEGFGAILSAFLNRSAHPGFFPNSILITCSQIVVFFQTACSFIIKEPAISDSIIESYIVYKNWYSE